MDCLRVEPRALGGAFGGTADRRAKRDLHGLREQDLEDGVDQSCLADPRSAGDHQHLGNESDANSLSLAVGERQPCPLLDPGDRPKDRHIGVDRRPGRPPDRECFELFGDLPLRPVQPGEENTTAALQVIGNYAAAFELMAERRVNELGGHFEQRSGERNQLFGR
jgi:hypothetical protein